MPSSAEKSAAPPAIVVGKTISGAGRRAADSVILIFEDPAGKTAGGSTVIGRAIATPASQWSNETEKTILNKCGCIFKKHFGNKPVQGRNCIFLVQEIFVPPIVLTIAQELTENDDFDGGENGEWG